MTAVNPVLAARTPRAREVRVHDVAQVPMPLLTVTRAAPEGVGVKSTKSSHRHMVPVADRVLPIPRALAAGRGPDDLLLVTAAGHRLHALAVKRSVGWSNVAAGRRIHDLRHTAACLWLARGVDPGTV
jgi:integrase